MRAQAFAPPPRPSPNTSLPTTTLYFVSSSSAQEAAACCRSPKRAPGCPHPYPTPNTAAFCLFAGRGALVPPLVVLVSSPHRPFPPLHCCPPAPFSLRSVPCAAQQTPLHPPFILAQPLLVAPPPRLPRILVHKTAGNAAVSPSSQPLSPPYRRGYGFHSFLLSFAAIARVVPPPVCACCDGWPCVWRCVLEVAPLLPCLLQDFLHCFAPVGFAFRFCRRPPPAPPQPLPQPANVARSVFLCLPLPVFFSRIRCKERACFVGSLVVWGVGGAAVRCVLSAFTPPRRRHGGTRRARRRIAA